MSQDGTTAGGSSYTIDNVTFPVGRTKLNAILDAIRTTNIGNTPPDLVAGQFWIDNNTPSTTVWTLYFYDGTDSIQFATIDTTANTVNFIDSTFDLVNDTTPQLGGTLDANGNDIDMGTNTITDTKVGQWDTAYGWGDHSTEGYITASSTNTLTNKSGNISQWTNDAGYITSETDSQTLSFSNPNLSISNGNSVDLSSLSSDVVNDTTPQLGGDLDLNSNDITGTGNINITGSVTATSYSGDGSGLTGISANADLVNDTTPQLGGNLDLNSNNITGTGNVNITGTVTATSFSGDGSSLTGITSVGGAVGVDFNDNVKARFGTGNDLEIYHDGSNSYINDVGTGNLYIRGDNDLIITNASGTENKAIFGSNSDVALYYDNSRKFETTSTGIDVTGTVTANGISLGDNETINVGASNDLQIYHDGSNSYISDQGTGSLYLQGTNLVLEATDGTNYLAGFDGTATRIYHPDATNGEKLTTTSTGINVTGTLTATTFSGSGSGITGIPNTASVWVNFNGTGTVAIRDDYNVSTITDHDTGLYTINFSTALTDNDYACGGMACDRSNSGGAAYVAFRSPYYQGIDTILTTTSTKVNIINSGNQGVDPQACTFIAFR
jgi:hypothetical protein